MHWTNNCVDGARFKTLWGTYKELLVEVPSRALTLCAFFTKLYPERTIAICHIYTHIFGWCDQFHLQSCTNGNFIIWINQETPIIKKSCELLQATYIDHLFEWFSDTFVDKQVCVYKHEYISSISYVSIPPTDSWALRLTVWHRYHHSSNHKAYKVILFHCAVTKSLCW